ncbi:unnamed protein product [Dovyalis caffra]|uniref:Uncharacterized protein n=1 Tax=Dovyalis caffra TaxID=77055 RepID=A0AAV1QXV8_9ROSI|nr:unnamed protein product [Dovyalis caffra]
MHLWPTMRIRDSFKISYLKKLEWNLNRMNSDKKQKSQKTSCNDNQQRLLDDERYSCSSLVATVVSVVELVSIKTRNDGVLEGVRPLNLVLKDNNSEGGINGITLICEREGEIEKRFQEKSVLAVIRR